MPNFDDTTTDSHDDALDERLDDDLANYISEDISPDGRFVRVTEDIVVDILTGNQYMPKR